MTDIKQFIRDLNQTWMDHRYDDLYLYYHEAVVMLPPGGSEPVVGIEPMVASYRQFGAMGTLHQFDIIDLSVYEYDTVAMCHMRFVVDYEIESGRFKEEGLEIYTVATSEGQPRIVWRSQVTLKTD